MSPPNWSDSELDIGVTLRGFAPKQRLFDRYELREILGRGGMGVVWRAYDEQLERDVALKFLPELLVLDPAAMNELKRETKRSLELTHHHIVRIYDFAQDNRCACISMECVDGQTVAAARLEKPNKIFEVEDLGLVVEQACDALEYAHLKARIVHRDLKPANLMRNSHGELKVADFGISRSLTDSVSMLSMRTSGTLVYMSPQQLGGERAAPMDDIYSLGATAYELLTGKPPFYSGGIEIQIREKVPPAMGARREALEISTGKRIPEQWEATIAACLAKDPGQRPRSAAEVARRLGLAVPQYGGTVFSVPPKTPPPAKPAPDKPVELLAPPRKLSFALLAIAVLLAAGGLWVWYLRFVVPRDVARQAQDTSATVAEAKVPPPPDRETFGEYTYTGMVGPYEAIFHLKFEPGERVTGYYNLPKSTNNHIILRLEGRYPAGKLYLDEYTNERVSARIELTLNRSSTEIRWAGTMYNTDKRVFPVSFSRSR